MARKRNLNPLGLRLGDLVHIDPREDGRPHPHGDAAIWEITHALPEYGTATLHLVGAGPEVTCGAFLGALTHA